MAKNNAAEAIRETCRILEEDIEKKQTALEQLRSLISDEKPPSKGPTRQKKASPPKASGAKKEKTSGKQRGPVSYAEVTECLEDIGEPASEQQIKHWLAYFRNRSTTKQWLLKLLYNGRERGQYTQVADKWTVPSTEK